MIGCFVSVEPANLEVYTLALHDALPISNGFTGGVIDGAGTVTVNGTLTWTGGTMRGTGSTTIAASGTLVLDGWEEHGYERQSPRNLTNNLPAVNTPSSVRYGA